MKLLLIITLLITSCGVEVKPTSTPPIEVGTTTSPEGGKSPSSPEGDKGVTSPSKEEDPSSTATPAALTKDQQSRLNVRHYLDYLAHGDRLFKGVDGVLIFRSDLGSMGSPEKDYLPETTPNVTTTCSDGFEQTGMVLLSRAVSAQLFEKLPPEAPWAWTGDRASTLANGEAGQYYAIATSTFTDTWGMTFTGGMTYGKDAHRILGRVYCFIDSSKLPSLDDIPEAARNFNPYFKNGQPE